MEKKEKKRKKKKKKEKRNIEVSKIFNFGNLKKGKKKIGMGHIIREMGYFFFFISMSRNTPVNSIYEVNVNIPDGVVAGDVDDVGG